MLRLDEPSVALSERFHEGLVAPDAAREDPVLARWARVQRLGVSPDSAAFPADPGGDLVVRRERLEDIFREDNTLLDPLAKQLAARDVITLLADPEGVIVTSRGGGTFKDGAMKVRLIEGAGWAENARGTNAIGTAIAEGNAVAVLGRAHYEHRNTDLFCYATPVRDAYGDLVAVVDLTGTMDHNDPAFALTVQSAGSALERAIRARTFGRARMGLPVLERLVARSRSPALIVEATGGVRIANEMARAMLDGGVGQAAAVPKALAREEALTSEKIFGVPFPQLANMALTGNRGARFETRAATYTVELDPLLGPDGRMLAVVVYFDPVAPRRSVRESTPVRVPESVHPAFAPLVGNDPAFLQAKALAERFAATELPVLLLAETGTGKELFARAIHGASARSHGPFVALNCGAISETLLESELFGYAPGAFTGAARTGSEGKIGAANGGTLFLDEIAEMPEALQAALLRVLDDGAYYRVGEGRPRKSSFRLICATSKDLPALVEHGGFRRDLFYRIHGAVVTIPPLRERSDRRMLAKALLAEMQANGGGGAKGAGVELSEDAEREIERHDWPGNVRELRSALMHALALAGDGPIGVEHFPRVLVAAEARGDEGGRRRASGERTKEDAVREEYAAAVRASGGNVAEAARKLGVARSTVYRALKGATKGS